ncbi:hypothetical protein EMIHUDRAFT_56659, partial [Emiliania huxleyi CCMP1516]|uniref:STEEP1 domain-containing protein n=2 Tax=Emiliania huxleyi TaxID=2903 RepID=A0A0D3II66_EMIH1
MPKRATHTFESEKDGVQSEQLNQCFCLCCGESVLILGPRVALGALPRRRTDGALVLDRQRTQFKIKTKPGQSVLLRRGDAYERQWRANCPGCGVPIAYACSEGAFDSIPVTYLIEDAVGAQADLYMQLYQVPPCIQTAADGSLRIALLLRCEEPKKAVTHISNGEVGVSVVAPAREGLGNAEALDLLAKVLGKERRGLSLSRGWDQQSKFLTLSGVSAQDAFRR